MTSKRNGDYVGAKRAKNLSGNLGTSSTTQNSIIQDGTVGPGYGDLKYEPLPPAKKRKSTPSASAFYSGHIGLIISLVLVIVAIVIFFIHLDVNVSLIKSDVGDLKSKTDKLNEQRIVEINNNERIVNELQRIENETNRTQEYLQSSKGRK